MRIRFFNIRIVCFALALLYVATINSYAPALQAEQNSPHGLIILGLLALVTLGAFASILVLEWSRIILVYGNILLGLYLFGLSFLSSHYQIIDIRVMGFIFLMGVFFEMPSIRAIFLAQSRGGIPQSILCIDDDLIALKTIRATLLNRGFSVLTTQSAKEGIDIAEAQKPDLIILDVIMPEMNGRELCRRLKESSNTQNIPIIFLTAKDSPDDKAAELELGAETHLTKPIEPKILIATVRDILKR